MKIAFISPYPLSACQKHLRSIEKGAPFFKISVYLVYGDEHGVYYEVNQWRYGRRLSQIAVDLIYRDEATTSIDVNAQIDTIPRVIFILFMVGCITAVFSAASNGQNQFVAAALMGLACGFFNWLVWTRWRNQLAKQIEDALR